METTGLAERMAHIEGAFAQIDRRLSRVEAELSDLRGEIRALHGELRTLYRVTISVLIPMWVTIIGSIIAVALIH